MKTEYINQYGHTWRMFASVVKDFDDDSWLHTGRGANTPARLAAHILQGVKYYIEDNAKIHFASGKPFDIDSDKALEDDLPSQNDVLASIIEMKAKTEKWMVELEYRPWSAPPSSARCSKLP